MKKRQRSKKRVIRTIILIVAALAFGIGMYNFNAKNIMGNKMPMPFGYGMSVVMSGSMEERLSVNDLVVIKESDDYTVGDIVLFQDGGILIIHRIIAMDGDEITTKGDANNAADEPIKKSQIKGVLICDIAGIGGLVMLMKQPISIFVILALAFLLNELSYQKEKDKDIDELEEIKGEIERLIGEIKEQKEAEAGCEKNAELKKE